MIWTWVQQHRWLSLLALAIVILGTAGGTAWALVFRTVSSPINLKDALRLYRKETADERTPWRARLPRPGVYTYRSSGGESLSILGAQRGFPATSSFIVADTTCASTTWAPLQEHTETTTICPAADGAYDIPSMVTFETIGGTSTTSTLSCPSSLYLLPPRASLHPGARWSARCTLTNPREPVVINGIVLGPATIVVDGHRVATEHVRLTQNYAGDVSGISPADYWVSPASALIIRESEQVSVTQDGVQYHQNSDAQLTSLTPAQ